MTKKLVERIGIVTAQQSFTNEKIRDQYRYQSLGKPYGFETQHIALEANTS